MKWFAKPAALCAASLVPLLARRLILKIPWPDVRIGIVAYWYGAVLGGMLNLLVWEIRKKGSRETAQ